MFIFFFFMIILGELNKGGRNKLGDLKVFFFFCWSCREFYFLTVPLGSVAIYGYYCFGKQQEVPRCFLRELDAQPGVCPDGNKQWL